MTGILSEKICQALPSLGYRIRSTTRQMVMKMNSSSSGDSLDMLFRNTWNWSPCTNKLSSGWCDMVDTSATYDDFSFFERFYHDSFFCLIHMLLELYLFCLSPKWTTVSHCSCQSKWNAWGYCSSRDI